MQIRRPAILLAKRKKPAGDEDLDEEEWEDDEDWEEDDEESADGDSEE